MQEEFYKNSKLRLFILSTAIIFYQPEGINLERINNMVFILISFKVLLNFSLILSLPEIPEWQENNLLYLIIILFLYCKTYYLTVIFVIHSESQAILHQEFPCINFTLQRSKPGIRTRHLIHFGEFIVFLGVKTFQY